MRRIAALTLWVSGSICGLEAATPGSGNWADVHRQAADAAHGKNYNAELTLLTQCRALAQSPVQIAITDNDLGITLYRLGQSREAKKWLEQSLAAWKEAGEPFADSVPTAVALAEVDRGLGLYGEAETAMRAMLTGWEGPPRTEARALALGELGDILREEGRTSESRELLNEAARLPGVSWRRSVDSTLGLAELDKDEHRWEESIALWNDLAELGRIHGDANIEHVALRGLGQTWLERGDAARAEPLLRSALSGFQNEPDAGERQTGATLIGLGEIYLGENKLSMAEDYFNQALAIEERTLGADNPQAAVVLGLLGDTLARRSEMELARRNLERAARIMQAVFGEQSGPAGGALAHWGTVEQRSNHLPEAVSLFERALAALNAAKGGELDNMRIAVMKRYAEALKGMHRRQEANAVMEGVKSFRTR